MSSWYPWYYDEYERDAGHLDHVSDSCYRRIIDFYMRTREPIPRDPIRLMFITRTTPDQFAAAWPRIEGFFTLVNGLLHLKRCNIELDRQDARRMNSSHGGKKAAEKRSLQYQLLSKSTPSPLEVTGQHTGQDRTVDNKIDSSTSSIPYGVASETLAPLPPTPANEVKRDRSGKRGTRISPDWKPTSADVEFASQHGIANGAVSKIADEFRDYWSAASGRNAIKVDWSATWRNRIRTISDRRSGQNQSRAGTNRQGSGSLVTAMRNVMSGETGESDH